ncbi:MAG: hypothetical protein ABUM51_01070, partial [Bacteroidota bacterium]
MSVFFFMNQGVFTVRIFLPCCIFIFLVMPLDIYFLSNIVVWASNFAALIIGCLYCYRTGFPSYLRIFPFYLFVSFAVEIFANKYLRSYLPFPPSDDQLMAGKVLYNLFTVFETFIFTYFLWQLIRSTQIKKITIGLFILFLVYFVTSSVFEGMYYSNDPAILFESVIIIFLCLTFFRELFTRPEPMDLLREPSFWLVTGIFFYLATIFPLFLTG